MSKKTLKNAIANDNIKCAKCGKRDATGQDKMCDSCRFAIAIENIIESRT